MNYNHEAITGTTDNLYKAVKFEGGPYSATNNVGFYLSTAKDIISSFMDKEGNIQFDKLSDQQLQDLADLLGAVDYTIGHIYDNGGKLPKENLMFFKSAFDQTSDYYLDNSSRFEEKIFLFIPWKDHGEFLFNENSVFNNQQALNRLANDQVNTI